MYVRPNIERLGTFRELTLIGLDGASDGYIVLGNGGAVSGCSTGGIEVLCPTTS